MQDAVLGAVPIGSVIWNGFDPLNAAFPGITTTSGGAGYADVNGTSMASPHAAGVAALIIENHPTWSPGAVKAAVERTANHLDCPPDGELLGPGDQRQKCFGGGGYTSFFGHGFVDALSASQE